MNNPEKIFLNFILTNSLVKPDDKILLCVSGGPDSIGMFHLFKKIKNRFNLTLSVAHFNHLLRKDSGSDADFVAKLARRNGMPFFIEEKDIKRIAEERGQSIEECARIERYDFFFSLANLMKIKKIATAHTIDDQAETILMRIVKGSGLLGLSGILPRRFERGVEIIRPILNLSKEDLMEYLHKKEIMYKIDSTNSDVKFFRNKVRIELIPYLEKNYNPNIKKVLANMAENVSEDYNFLERITERYFDKNILIEENSVKISLAEFHNLDKALKKTIARKSIECLKGDLQGISFKNWTDIEELVFKKSYFKHSVSLPGKIFARRDSKNLIFESSVGALERKKQRRFHVLRSIGDFGIRDIGASINLSTVLGNKFDEKKKSSLNRSKVLTEFFDFDKIKFPILIRFKKPGDKLVPLGMVETKRLQDIFVDEKVPFEEREKIPILISKGKIVWVVGMKLSDEFKVTKKTEKMLKIEYQRL